MADLQALAERDRELTERAVALREREAQASQTRARAETIDEFFATYPREDDTRRAAVRAASDEVERRRAELAEAERAITTADDPEHARKAAVRARDHLAVAESLLLRARSAHGELEQQAGALPEELAELERRTGVSGAQAIVAWAAQARADVFVELGQIDLQRERVIREANELASMLLGESTHGSTAAQALEKVVGPLARE